MNLNDWVGVAQLVTAGAVVFAVLQLVGGRTQRHREFENLYVQRYWQLLDRMSERMYLGLEIAEPDDDERRLALAYLRLCEDEIDLRKQGFITNKTWAIWEDGILTQLRESPFRESLSGDGAALPALHEFVRTRQDPLKWSPLRKWWAGLH